MTTTSLAETIAMVDQEQTKPDEQLLLDTTQTESVAAPANIITEDDAQVKLCAEAKPFFPQSDVLIKNAIDLSGLTQTLTAATSQKPNPESNQNSEVTETINQIKTQQESLENQKQFDYAIKAMKA